MSHLSRVTTAYLGFIAGVLSVAALGYFYWRSQVTAPLDNGE